MVPDLIRPNWKPVLVVACFLYLVWSDSPCLRAAPLARKSARNRSPGACIGVLFGCFARKIDGDAYFTFSFLIYQGYPSISNQKGHLWACVWVAAGFVAGGL